MANPEQHDAATVGGQVRGVAGRARAVLGRLRGGRLASLPVTLRFWDGSELPAAADRPSAGVLHVRREAIGHLLRQPNQLGLARAYATGALELDGDLEVLLGERHRLEQGPPTRFPRRLVAAAHGLATAGPSAVRAAMAPATEARPRGRLHSLARDRQAVRHHYDVSNAFYRLLLGPSMVYSCAYFATPDDDLETAQERKLELICRKLRLGSGERFLDIGCGWGSLILHAARRHGVRAVGVTLSEPQAELARERIRDAGLADRCEVRVADYREIGDGPYDKIASVGMYEHVGAQLDAYAAKIAGLLRPGGLALNHGISRLHSAPPGSKNFIYRFVFPDGSLPPVANVTAALQRAGLETRDVESLREHYALTLRRWLANLDESRYEAIAEIGPERERIWRLYLTGSALGFEDGDVTVYQLLAVRHGAPHDLPLERPAFLAGAEIGA
jgi:cyclopropane-fatty-acyl-phospholipid synthase